MIKDSTLPPLILVLTTTMLVSGCKLSSNSSEKDRTETETPDKNGIQMEIVATGLQHPWGMTFLPNNDDHMLVTERPGRLLLVDRQTGETTLVTGTPEVAAVGQGGLLDVAVYPDYGPGQEWIYLTWAGANQDGTGYATHVGRGRLVDDDGPQLVGFEVLYVATPFAPGTGHFGSRLIFDANWHLYITVGDRRERDAAQDLQSHWGKTLRLERDGSIPVDNPFVDDPYALDAIYTYGHRNAQGMAIDPATGQIWQNEHGEQDGDEINIIDQAGGNYGWPIATCSREYQTGEPIGDLPQDNPNTVNPVFCWDGSEYDDGQKGFAPSGMAFFDGVHFDQWEIFPGWERGDLLMGNLAHRYLGRFSRHDRNIIHEERLLRDHNWRIRDVAVDPVQGHVYLLIDANDAPLVRLHPT
ncbi:hypothetical protein SAMN05421693_11276 [Ectothiorhodospira magna]|uniref:Glucose/Sorbosone dehydrogenase domain-containing protein n=1 Tax=Ectothiorhodospira magna TaxID=867345 RepID=A0A1H9C6L3_9GAMM|nr:PQQ-dependent sugar dehydrogenase [Ectothiorhodospira magna]SEP96870.1 hypothetical protein SAMN05421693_11276 [Ectothiorhodospira magna]